MHLLPKNAQPATIYTPMTNDVAAFFTANSPLSNHYPSTFTKDGVTYNCAEQFITCEKARLFNDQNTVHEVMKEKSAVKQKHLGRNIKDFDKQEWEKRAVELVVPGLFEKFRQCKVPREMLLSTGNRDIVEANPFDSFFGGGVALRSDDWKKKHWKGQNIMGSILKKIRDKLTQQVTQR